MSDLTIAIAFMAIKVLGYTSFACLINHSLHCRVSVWKFGAAQTVIGLAIGLAFLNVFVPELEIDELQGLELYLAALPVRLLAWAITIDLFLGFKKNTLEASGAVLLGTVWTYGLDWLIDSVDLLPGVQAAFC